MAAMTTQLAWGAITFQSGYEAAEQLTYMKECVQWATDYFIAAHKSDFELIAQVRQHPHHNIFKGVVALFYVSFASSCATFS